MPSMTEINKWRHGPAPTEQDAINTIAHLADTCDQNHVHCIRHLFEARDALEAFHGGDASMMESVAFNVQHSLKHCSEVVEHAEKLSDHIDAQDRLLTKVPRAILRTFSRLGDKLSKTQIEAIKLMDASFVLMTVAHSDHAAYRQLHDNLKKAYRLMEDANAIIEDITAAVEAHELTKAEYGRLSAHTRMPSTQLPQGTSHEWLQETLNLLTPTTK